MRHFLIIASFIMTAFIVQPMSAQANPGLIVKPSPYSVQMTLDRLEALFKKKGLSVFLRVDHQANAAKANLKMRASQVLIFGNPKLGTPLMVSQPEVAIALPLKALAWEDKNGKVWLGYTNPVLLAKRFAITDQAKVIKKMTGALNKLTNAALKK